MELIIEDIFQVKLPGSETNNPQYTVLSDEIDRNIDGIILAQLTENEQLLEPFAYLNNCYNRTLTRRRKNKNAKELQSSFDEIETLLVGYGLVAFQIEEFCMNGNFKNYIKRSLRKWMITQISFQRSLKELIKKDRY